MSKERIRSTTLIPQCLGLGSMHFDLRSFMQGSGIAGLCLPDCQNCSDCRVWDSVVRNTSRDLPISWWFKWHFLHKLSPTLLKKESITEVFECISAAYNWSLRGRAMRRHASRYLSLKIWTRPAPGGLHSRTRNPDRQRLQQLILCNWSCHVLKERSSKIVVRCLLNIMRNPVTTSLSDWNVEALEWSKISLGLLTFETPFDLEICFKIVYCINVTLTAGHSLVSHASHNERPSRWPASNPFSRGMSSTTGNWYMSG